MAIVDIPGIALAPCSLPHGPDAGKPRANADQPRPSCGPFILFRDGSRHARSSRNRSSPAFSTTTRRAARAAMDSRLRTSLPGRFSDTL
jgi:hypothetical protein